MDGHWVNKVGGERHPLAEQQHSYVQTVSDVPEWLAYLSLDVSEPLKDELYEAINHLWQHEEGREVMERAHAKHGVITIRYNEQQNSTHFNCLDATLSIDPDVFSSFSYVTESLERQPISLKRIVAHEMFHAQQEGLNDQRYTQARNDFTFDKDIAKSVTTLEKAKMYHELLGGDAFQEKKIHQKIALMKEVYAEPKTQERLQSFADQRVARYQECLDFHEAYRDFIQEVESPAVAFANRIMEGIEPARNTEYIEFLYNEQDRATLLLGNEGEFIKDSIIFMNGIKRAGSLEGYLSELHGQYVGEVQQLDREPVALVNNVHYHGAIKDLLLQDLPEH